MSERRLIDANALEQDLISKGLYPSIVKRAIENAPTIETELVRHGEWILEEDKSMMAAWERCSVCGFCTVDMSLNFCPECGSKMDKE